MLNGVLFTHLGTYMLVPYFSIILAKEKGLPLSQVGFVLAAGSVAYLIGSLLGGVISDRLGRRRTMVGGLIVRGGGLLLFIWAGSFPTLLAANLIAGAGSGFYMPSAKAGIATYAAQGERTTAFSWRGIAANIGVTLGPLLGTFLLTRSSTVLFAGTAVIYLALAAAHQVLIAADCTGDHCPETQRGSFRELLTDRPFLLFSFVTIFVWALFTQFALSLPLRADQIHAAERIGLIWTTTSVFVILLQSPLTRWFTKHLHPLQAMALGTVIVGIALGSVAFSSSFWHLLASAVLFNFGQMFIMPTSDAIVSDLSKPEQIGNYFGVAAFVFGAGEALGNMGGGQLMEYAVARHMLYLPWTLFAVTGVLVGLTYYALTFWGRLALPLNRVLGERVSPEQPATPSLPSPKNGKSPS